MGKMVSIDLYKEMKKKENLAERKLDQAMEDCGRAADAAGENCTIESAIEMVSALGLMACAMVDTPFGQYVSELEQKMDGNFRRRYQEVIESAPDMPVARIKYFCRELLKLQPAIGEGGWESRCSAHDDFCNIYGLVDHAVSAWCMYDLKTKEVDDAVQCEYPFLKLEVTKENMGVVLSETLRVILSIQPEESIEAKKGFLWNIARLSEVNRGIIYLFAEEVDARRDAMLHDTGGFGMGGMKTD